MGRGVASCRQVVGGECTKVSDRAEEVTSSPVHDNEITTHESLGQRPPLALHRVDPHLFQALSLQRP